MTKEYTNEEKWEFIKRNGAIINHVAHMYKKTLAWNGYEFEDLKQCIYEELIKCMHKYDPDRGSETTFVYLYGCRILNNIVIETEAKRRIPNNQLLYFGDILEKEGPINFEDYFEDRRQSVEDVIVWNEALDRELTRLDDPRDILIIAAEVNGMSVVEISKLIGQSVWMASTRKRELFALLAQRLDDRKPLIHPKFQSIGDGNRSY